MGIRNLLRLGGVTTADRRIESKAIGNKKARFGRSASRFVKSLSKTKVGRFFLEKWNKARRDRHLDTRNITTSESTVADVMFGKRDEVSDSSIKTLRAKTNLDLELNKVRLMREQHQKAEAALLKMEEELLKEQSARMEKEATRQVEDKSLVLAANKAGFDRVRDNATSSHFQNYIDSMVDRSLVKALKPFILQNQGKVPSRQGLLDIISQIKDSKHQAFEKNAKELTLWRDEAYQRDDQLMKVDQDRMNEMVAMMELEKRLENYEQNIKASLINPNHSYQYDNDPLMHFIAVYNEELGVSTRFGYGDSVPNRYAGLFDATAGHSAQGAPGYQEILGTTDAKQRSDYTEYQSVDKSLPEIEAENPFAQSGSGKPSGYGTFKE